MNNAYIREIFLSIQGEGPHVGEEQLFIRFCSCNLKCKYCDTDFETSKATEYTPEKLLDTVNSYGKNLTISLTGGEPLLSHKFLKEFLPMARKCGHTIYLETNATLPEFLAELTDFIDIVSADIKLESATGEKINPDILEEFFSIAKSKELFAKIVFNNNITQDEISNSIKIAEQNNCEIILQPEMTNDKFSVTTEFCEKIFKMFKSKYPKTRLIPQMHKFLNVR